jgi:hypothetical protein
MRLEHHNSPKLFERGAVIFSFDTEQIWGYFDRMNEQQFESQYPGALDAHEKLLSCLRTAGISATWFVVGGMALGGSEGAQDGRMAGLPRFWVDRIPPGTEATVPLWYRRSFVDLLRESRPFQEIGLHGGLTHLIWTDALATQKIAARELSEGVKALEQALVRPLSFSFGREREAYHALLPAHGIRCYRGRTPVLACQLGRTLPGALLRAWDELLRATPPPVWPQETLPGLWNIPSSLFLYPIGPSRTKIVALRSRFERFRRGLEAAVSCGGIFHFCLHPENLAESSYGFSIFEDILELVIQFQDRGDVEVLTMGQVAARMQCVHEETAADRVTDLSGDALAEMARSVSQ